MFFCCAGEVGWKRAEGAALPARVSRLALAYTIPNVSYIIYVIYPSVCLYCTRSRELGGRILRFLAFFAHGSFRAPRHYTQIHGLPRGRKKQSPKPKLVLARSSSRTEQKVKIPRRRVVDERGAVLGRPRAGAGCALSMYVRRARALVVRSEAMQDVRKHENS